MPAASASLRSIAPLVCTAALASLACVSSVAHACTGDCDDNGAVAVNEAVRGVAIALEQSPLSACPSFDRDGSGTVTVNELLQAINAVLGGCPTTPQPTEPGSATTTATATPSPSPRHTDTPTPTATVNQPPRLSNASVYRAYEGFDVQLPVATDPEGGPVQCTADALPAGATLDGALLRWTPSHDQLGPQYVPLTCSDAAQPPATTSDQLIFKVLPVDPCITPSCDPASGCAPTLAPLSPRCCPAEPVPRVAEPVAGCPEGRVVFIGRNVSGFGRLQDCDIIRVRNFAQSGAEIDLHVETRCLSTLNRIEVQMRIETAHRLVVNAIASDFFADLANGVARRRNFQFTVMGPGPFFDLEDDGEANVTVTATDSEGHSATTQLRLRLSFSPQPDLPDATLTAPPS